MNRFFWNLKNCTQLYHVKKMGNKNLYIQKLIYCLKILNSYIKNSFILTVVLMRLGEIPVPIPNTAVKSRPVDDT